MTSASKRNRAWLSRVVGVAVLDLLQGDLAVQLLVQGDEDLAQPAPGVRPDDPEPPVEARRLGGPEPPAPGAPALQLPWRLRRATTSIVSATARVAYGSTSVFSSRWLALHAGGERVALGRLQIGRVLRSTGPAPIVSAVS